MASTRISYKTFTQSINKVSQTVANQDLIDDYEPEQKTTLERICETYSQPLGCPEPLFQIPLIHESAQQVKHIEFHAKSQRVIYGVGSKIYATNIEKALGGQQQLLYEIQDCQQDVLLKLTHDGKLIITERTNFFIIDLEDGNQKYECNSISNIDNRYPILKLEVAKDNQCFIALTEKCVYKQSLNYEDSFDLTQAQYSCLDDGKKFTDMCFNNDDSLFICEIDGSQSAIMIEVDLNDLQKVNQIQTDSLSSAYHFIYSAKNKIFWSKKQNSNILKASPLNSKQQRDKIQVCESIEMPPLLEYPEKNLIFAGGDYNLCVVEQNTKKVVADFCFKFERENQIDTENKPSTSFGGLIQDLKFTQDRQHLLVQCKIVQLDEEENNNNIIDQDQKQEESNIYIIKLKDKVFDEIDMKASSVDFICQSGNDLEANQLYCVLNTNQLKLCHLNFQIENKFDLTKVVKDDIFEFTHPVSQIAVDAKEEYCYMVDKTKQRVFRVRLNNQSNQNKLEQREIVEEETGEKNDHGLQIIEQDREQEIEIGQDISKVYQMIVTNTENYPGGVLILRTNKGIRVFSCETLERIVHFNTNRKKSEFTSMIYIASIDRLLSGSTQGVLREHEISYENNESSISDKKFHQLRSTIIGMKVSQPEETYMAVSTDNGNVHIFRIDLSEDYETQIDEDNDNQQNYQSEVANYHNKIRKFCIFELEDQNRADEMEFIRVSKKPLPNDQSKIDSEDQNETEMQIDNEIKNENETDFLLACRVKDTISLLCLNEQEQIFEYNQFSGKLMQILYNYKTKSLFVRQNNDKLIIFDHSFDDEFFEKLQQKINQTLNENMKRQLLLEDIKGKQETKQACMDLIEQNGIFMFEKINLTSIAASMGVQQVLSMTIHQYGMLMGIDGQTLIQVCDEKKDLDCIQICLENLASGQGILNWQTFGIILTSNNNDEICDILSKELIHKPIYDESVKQKLPIQGKITNQVFETQTKIIRLKNLQQVYQEQDKNHLKHKITIETFKIPVNMTLGSYTCSEMLQFYDNAENDNLQISQSCMYVDALWFKYKRYVRAYALIQAMPFALLVNATIVNTSEKQWMVPTFVCSIVMILNELTQMKVKGWAYFNQAYNILDLIGHLAALKFARNRYVHGMEVYNMQVSQATLIIALLNLGLRSVSQLRIFEKFSLLIEILKYTIIDMFPFTMILMAIFFEMTCITLVQKNMGQDKDHTADSIPAQFWKTAGDTYQIIFGENPSPDDMHMLEWVVYIMFSFLVIVVLLNMLIAIMGDTFGRVTSTAQASRCKTKAQILDELQDLMFLNRDNNELVYIHFVRYANQVNGTDGHEDDVCAKVNDLQAVVEEMNGNLKRLVEVQEKQLQ